MISGYPTDQDPPTKRKLFISTKKKGDRGFIEGCLFALCCCWLCEECC
ncbi:cysteine-rich TM module stress tolerance protein [Medicago truncatula]|uniref:Cysteine-rich TM module stress tolerance protein n=1 Tax=Medicago truncatula TaxID=3880 RepID=A0A072U371_MEDTR|nr:cysteine-rich TM module stress tolerance protein [Medicago truncatula]